MWRADCTADSPPPLCTARWQTGQPRFEAWDGEKFELFAGKPDIQTLNQWAIASLRHFSPPARLATESPDMGSSKGTLFVSPSQEGTAAQTSNPQIPFAQFSVYGDAFPALARTLGREIGDDGASVVDVGCGHGLLVEAHRAAGRSASYCVEGSADAYDAWPHAYRDEFYSVQDFAVDGATLPPTEIVTSFEVGEHLPPATAFVEMLTAHAPRLVFFGAATVRQDSQLVNGKWVSMNPTHVNEQPFAYWVERFAAAGYALDAARAARLRVALFADPGYQKALQTCRAWWYAKNLLVFRRDQPTARRSTPSSPRARHRRRPLCRPLRRRRRSGRARGGASRQPPRDGARPPVRGARHRLDVAARQRRVRRAVRARARRRRREDPGRPRRPGVGRGEGAGRAVGILFLTISLAKHQATRTRMGSRTVHWLRAGYLAARFGGTWVPYASVTAGRRDGFACSTPH